MIFKLLWKNNSIFQLFAASIGSLIGFCLLLISLEIYFDIKSIFSSEKDLIKPEYIVINKKLSLLKTLNITSSEFSDNEIEEIKKQEFVNSISPFISNSFEVSAYTNASQNVPDFYTDLFFEAIPNEYLDIDNNQWNWNLEDSLVPIVIPNDYLNLYNFGFAQSQGLPQISANMVGLVSFNLQINGNNKTIFLRGKIVAFSDRINSILVPYDFLNWANKEFGDGKKNPSRLILITKDPSNPNIIKDLETNNYETNKDKLKNSKLNTIFKIAISITSIVSFLIIFLSVMIFILGFQLLITKSAEKLKILLNLGYRHIYLSSFYIVIFIFILIPINLISFGILKIVDSKLFIYLTERGFKISDNLNYQVLIAGIILSFLILIFNSLSIIFKLKYKLNN